MNTSAKLAIAAAALVVVGFVSINLLPASGGRGSGPSPSAMPRPSPSPTTAGDPIDGPVIGRRSLTVDGVPFSFRVPTSGWELFVSLHISTSTAGSQGAEALIYWARFPDGVDADWCGELGSSAADVAADVSTAAGTELVTRPSDVTVGGRAAKHVVVVVREDFGCDPGFFYNWKAKLGGALWTETKPGDTIRVWIVDVDGALLFIAGITKPDAGSRVEQEIQQIVGSIRFD